MHFSALYVTCAMDGRTSRCITEVLEWKRHEDAEDLGRKTPKEPVDNLVALNAFGKAVEEDMTDSTGVVMEVDHGIS